MNVLSPEILSRIKEIIKSSDINTISAKRIRKQVLSEFEISMDKQVLDQEIIAVYKEFVDLGQSKEKVKGAWSR